jgi:hypothetical protein
MHGLPVQVAVPWLAPRPAIGPSGSYPPRTPPPCIAPVGAAFGQPPGPSALCKDAIFAFGSRAAPPVCRRRSGRARLNDRCSRTAGRPGHWPDPHRASGRTEASDHRPSGAGSGGSANEAPATLARMTGRRIMPRPMASRSACWPASSPTPADAEDPELSQLAWRDLGQARQRPSPMSYYAIGRRRLPLLAEAVA